MTIARRPALEARAAERHPDAPRRIAVAAMFAVYLALLVWTVLFKLDVPFTGGVDRAIKLVPFVASPGFGASQPSEVVMNVVLFAPFGLYLGLVAHGRSLWMMTAAIAGTSLALEAAQFALATGSSDITDVIANTAGGLAGLWLFALAGRLLGARTTVVMTRVCAVMTIVAVLAAGVFVASPLHYGPPPGGMRDHSGLRLNPDSP
ncbi:VanZ family protein [Microbacterium sp. NPDC019599]|uniref:VanZ family protein n=1 Tax=Microbacterium sp. NPDC019599 TaxID=3154690 RepID=UPI0033FC7D7C